MSKIIMFDEEARQKIKAGIDKVADAVKITIGPRGRNVIMDKGFGSPVITNDGVSIAKEIELEDKFENIGADLIKEVANKTNDNAGDGTTTATVLAQAIVREGSKLVATGMNPISIRHGIEDAKNDVIAELKKISKAIGSKEEIAQVATISAESAEMGTMISEVITQVGKDGVITVEESQTFGLEYEIVEGMNFDKGYISPYMITSNETLKAELKDAYIIIADKKISAVAEILPILEKITASGKKEIVIIAEDVDGEALTTLVVNKLRGILNVLAIKAPEFGDNKKAMLEDIATITGGRVISQELGMKLETAELNMLGQASRIIATKDTTTIVGGKGKKKEIEVRVTQIQKQLLSSESKWDKEKIQKRLAKISGGVAVIKVGAATETELTYMKHKMEDALSATRAAYAEGIVAGGGVALLRVANGLSAKSKADKKFSENNLEYGVGYKMLLRALEEPAKQIVANGGQEDPGVVIYEITKNKLANYGFDASSGEYVSDMLKSGIIDPMKVTRTALENAVSVASIFLTTQVAIADKPEKKEAPMGGGMPGMGGMM
ncbi:MAG: chaperonin GroEL [Candidatus Moraniibacteriota bacterium]